MTTGGLDRRFGLQKFRYTWTDRDQECAHLSANAYRENRRRGLSHEEAQKELANQIPNSRLHAGPANLLIPLFSPDADHLWDHAVVAHKTIELSLPELKRKAPGTRVMKHYIRPLALWHTLRIEELEWQQLEGDALDAVRSSSTLAAAMKALHELDGRRFPTALYSPATVRFRDYAQRLFEFWGNTDYRALATSGGRDSDHAPQEATIPTLPAVVEGKSLEWVPVMTPLRTTQPVTPGKNKLAATQTAAFKVHLAKLNRLAAINVECHDQLDILQSHQARAEGIAKTLTNFATVFPVLRQPGSVEHLTAATAGFQRLARLSDDEVFARDPALFAAPPAFTFGGLVTRRIPKEPPLARGLRATREMVQLLSEDPEAGEAARNWAIASVVADRGRLHASSPLEQVSNAVNSILVVDDKLAAQTFAVLDAHLTRAPKEPAQRTSDLTAGRSPPSFLDFFFKLNGTLVAPWATKVPALVGNFQGPSSLAVALGNAAGFLGAWDLRRFGGESALAKRYVKWAAKCFDEANAAKLEAALASTDKRALERFLTEQLKSPDGLTLFGKPVKNRGPVAAGGFMAAPWFLSVVAFCQISANIDSINQFRSAKMDADGGFVVVNMLLSSVQTYTFVKEAAEHAIAWTKGATVAAKTLQCLERTNIVLGGLMSVTNMLQGSYNAAKAFERGDTVKVGFEVTRALCNGALLGALFIPPPAGPILQAGAMVVLLLADVFESSHNEKDLAEAVACPANRHLRSVIARSLSDATNPLAPFMNDRERQALQGLRVFTGTIPILHPLRHQPAVAPGTFGNDTKILRECGFNLEEIGNLLGRPLTPEELA